MINLTSEKVHLAYIQESLSKAKLVKMIQIRSIVSETFGKWELSYWCQEYKLVQLFLEGGGHRF